MEDFIQILVIVIFILSSLASSFKKKKKSQKVPGSSKQIPQQKPGVANTNEPKKKSTEQILEELLGLKVDLPEPQPREAQPSYAEEQTWDPSKEFYENENIDNDVKNSYRDIVKDKKAELKKGSLKHRAFKDSPSIVSPHSKRGKSKARKLIENQNSLKDLVVINEILNKPKALRK